MNLRIKNKNNPGFTFIEALTLLFIFSLITITFYNVITVGTRYIAFSKNRLGAVALANEKMEIVRNLSYDDIGIVDGVVNGNILPEEELTRSNKFYTVHTLVQYVDDPFDGTLGGSPNDTAYKDYKIVKISVLWDSGQNEQGEVNISSVFSSASLEVASEGDGILAINVFSSQDGGIAVPQATVRIVNPDVGIDETIETDNEGHIMLVGAKESIQRYQLTISKSGYETVTTYPPYPDSAYNPVDIHASVLSGMLNIASVDINKSGSIRIRTINNLGEAVENVDFEISGGRKLGTEILDPFGDIYNFSEIDSTDSDGEKIYDDLSPGEYMLTYSDEDYDLISIDPPAPLYLTPEGALDIQIKLFQKDTTGFRAKIADANSLPISGAQVKLSNAALSYESTVATGLDGVAFFPTGEDLLVGGTYELSVEADGFETSSGSQEIIESQINEEDISLMEN